MEEMTNQPLEAAQPAPETTPDTTQETISSTAPQDQPETSRDTEVSPKRKSFSPGEINMMSCPQLVDAVVLLMQGEELPHKREVDALRNAFHKKKQALESSEEPEDKALLEEAAIQESRLNDIYDNFSQRYRAYRQALQEEQEANYKQKLALIPDLEKLVESTDEFGLIYKQFNEIRDRWRSIGQVPEEHYEKLQKQYNELEERFYDLKQINDDFRDLDFKKNLEQKQALIDRAKALAEAESVIHGYKEINELHRQWKEIGPVNKELREEIWTQFSQLSRQIRQRFEEYINGRKENEQNNLELKEKLCTMVEEIPVADLKSGRAWGNYTQQIIDAQKKWKEIGPVPRDKSNAVYKRFRAACDYFFSHKTIFFKERRSSHEENLARRNELIRQAEELAQSTDWSSTAQKLKELQNEWKEVGPVDRRHSDETWKRFRQACNTFFNARKEQNKAHHQQETQNLEIKRGLIKEAEALLEKEEESVEKLRAELQQIIQRFNATGHVPYSQKEKIYSGFNKVVDAIFDKFKIERQSKRLEIFNDEIDRLQESGDMHKLRSEIDHLYKVKNRLVQEQALVEGNMENISASSSWGADMLKGLENKLSRLSNEIELIDQKIAVVQQRIKESKENKQ